MKNRKNKENNPKLCAQMRADGSAVLEIMDELGTWGYRLQDFTAALEAVKDAPTVTLRINSPGGDVVEAYAIADLVRNHPARFNCEVYGLCASAATLIALACDDIAMAENAQWMVHEPTFALRGNLSQVKVLLDAYEAMRNKILALYAAAAGKTEEEIVSDLAADMWLSAADARAYGWPVRVIGQPAAAEEPPAQPGNPPTDAEDPEPAADPDEPPTDDEDDKKPTAAARLMALLGLRTPAQKRADALEYWQHRATVAEATATGFRAAAALARTDAAAAVEREKQGVEERINAAVAKQLAAMAADGDTLPAPAAALPARTVMSMAEIARSHGADAAIAAHAAALKY